MFCSSSWIPYFMSLVQILFIYNDKEETYVVSSYDIKVIFNTIILLKTYKNEVCSRIWT